ncbi:hypothetical protein [Rhodococcus aetherivorans]|uniref:hypothetical protein n=1 Tax=Rhodococcus aetherivorans TaxID=191292 RepID=UPI0038908319
MNGPTQSTLRFWSPTFDFTTAREVPHAYTDDARLLRIELDTDDAIACSVMESEFDDAPGPYTHVTDDTGGGDGTRWTGRLDQVSFERLSDGRRVVGLTYRNTAVKSEFEKLLEALP